SVSARERPASAASRARTAPPSSAVASSTWRSRRARSGLSGDFELGMARSARGVYREDALAPPQNGPIRALPGVGGLLSLIGVQAGFLDPQGRKSTRLAIYVLPVFALLYAVFGPLEGVPAWTTGLSAFGLLHAVALVDLRQRKLRMAELECGPGYVAVK